MKKKILQQIFAFAATALTCITVLAGAPGIPGHNSSASAPGNDGYIPGIENPEEGNEEEPGIDPQNDYENEGKKHD